MGWSLDIEIGAEGLGTVPGSLIELTFTIQLSPYEKLVSLSPSIPMKPNESWDVLNLFTRADIPYEWVHPKTDSESQMEEQTDEVPSGGVDENEEATIPLETNSSVQPSDEFPANEDQNDADVESETTPLAEPLPVEIPPFPEEPPYELEIIPYADGAQYHISQHTDAQKNRMLTVRCQVRIFDYRLFHIRTLHVVYTSGGMKKQTFVPAATLHLRQLKLQENAQPLPLSPYIENPHTFWNSPLFYVLLAGVILGVITLILFLILKYGVKTRVYGHLRTPYEIAMEEMRTLIQSELLASGEIKEFHVELSIIIRRFLSRTFRIFIMETTTQRVPGLLKLRGVESDHQTKIMQFLETCDMVKFAKVIPNSDEIDLTYQRGMDIVQRMERPELVTHPAASASSQTKGE